MAKAPKKKKDRPYQSVLEKHPKHVKAIGMITIEMGNLDVLLSDLLGVVLDRHRDISEAIYFTPRAGMVRIEILDATVAALADLPEEPRKRVLHLTRRARALMNKRHGYIHDIWGIGEETGLPGRGKAAKKMDPVPIAELTTMINDIRQLITEIHESLESVHSGLWLATSPKKSDK